MIRFLSVCLVLMVVGWGLGVVTGQMYQKRQDQWEYTTRSVTHELKGDKLVIGR